MEGTFTPCYSARFVDPFARVLSCYESYPIDSLEKLKAIDPTSRIPARRANELLVEQVEKIGDADLGLKAGCILPFGRAGALEYAMRTSATMRKAIELGGRYVRLFSDVLDVRLELSGNRAMVQLRSTTPAPRPVSDFTMSAWYRVHARDALADARLEVWFSHSKPADTEEYDRTFAATTLRFAAPFCGFVFPRDYLDVPLATADPPLHAVLCDHVALLNARLSERRMVASKVREIALRELLDLPPASDVARQLHTSSRTLHRNLRREGTSFRRVLDHLRREVALRDVENTKIPFEEVAARIGFSHAAAFYRAFKRWTGQTPLTYRRTWREGRPELRL